MLSHNNKKQKLSSEEIPRGTENILFIEDEDIIRSFGKLSLERYGYTVFSASQGNEGLTLFNKLKKDIQLVILDLSLPDLSGVKVYHEIHQMYPEVKVIISSGYGKEYVNKSFKSEDMNDIDDFITKPYSMQDLVHIVRRVLDTEKKNNIERKCL